MKQIRKLFFETKMTWPRVILFAAATAVVTAVLLLIPATAHTSLSYIGVTLDCWFLFALIVALNCGGMMEAGVKTAVFFLVSQPLIYLLQVPFAELGWEIFRYYPRWFLWTLLTLPGGMIAWLVKKDNVWSALILSVATGYLGFAGVWYASDCVADFPRELAAAVFCLAMAAILIFALLRSRKNRIIASVVTLIAVIASAVILLISGGAAPKVRADYDLPDGHDWYVTTQIGDMCSVTVDADGSNAVIEANRYGTSTVIFADERDARITLTVTYTVSDGFRLKTEE